MGALANATILRHDPTFRDWVETAIVYQSQLVIAGDSGAPSGTTTQQKALRLRLAQDAAVVPGQILELCVGAIACDPSIANQGTSADQIGEAPFIAKMAAIWTAIAQLTYPQGL